MRELKYCKYNEEERVLVSYDEPVEFEKPASFAHFILELFEKHGDRPFLTEASTDVTMTFSEVKQVSFKIASSFINHLSLQMGDVVFGYAFTSSMYACAVYACNFAGLVFTGEPPRLSPVSLAPQVNNSETKVVLCVLESLPRLITTLEQCPLVKTVIVIDSQGHLDSNNNDLKVPDGVKLMSLSDLIEGGDASDPQLPRVPQNTEEDQLVFLPYSSGTTGLAKGVKRCGSSMIGMCYNVNFRGLHGVAGDVVSFFQSLGHTSGQLGLVYNLFHGAHVIVMPELNLERLFESIDKYKITCGFIPPTSIQAIAKMDHLGDYDVSSLRVVSTGGAPLVASVVEDFKKKFPNFERLINGYGMSEGPIGTLLTNDEEGYDSVGSVVRGVELKIVDPVTKKVCSFNETGELWLRSPFSASGYLKRPDAEAETWVEDGWLRTGDAGYYDEKGLVYLVDRYKEMIKVHINQVAPAELQAILALHPQVSEACVIAAPHPETGETPRAFVVPKDTNNLPDEDDILAFVNNQVVEYRKINGGLFLVQSLPKIVIGKVNRQLVKRNPEKLVYLNPKRKPENVP